jgi:hypothetical protein
MSTRPYKPALISDYRRASERRPIEQPRSGLDAWGRLPLVVMPKRRSTGLLWALAGAAGMLAALIVLGAVLIVVFVVIFG